MTDEPDPLELFGPKLEQIVSGALKSAIKAHGPITAELLASGTKRVASQLRAYLKQFATQELVDESVKQSLDASKKEREGLQEKNNRLRRQVSKLGDGLRQIRDGSTDPAEVAKQCILDARKGRKVC